MHLTLESSTTLHTGITIPLLGLGVFKASDGAETEDAVRDALAAGYRHVDTAMIYGNEASVGAALRASALPREAVFVTTKLWNTDQGYERAMRACDKSLEALGLDQLDLYLIHWPVEGSRQETWRAMEALLAAGKTRAIGVSNYMQQHLEELESYASVLPTVNQIELSPYNYLFRKPTVDWCASRNIVVEAYSPLTKGMKLREKRLLEIAAEYGKSTAQILIRWGLQMGFVVLPKSTTPERIAENADVYGFELSDADMARLEKLNENLVTGWDPTDAP
ncbi:MAG: aldo/keto reductase [Ignavibacteria bacterium]|nr:aldo/keto reductase [Ignavibacteria bacterium]